MRNFLNRPLGGPGLLALILAVLCIPLVGIVLAIGDTQGTSGSGYNQGWAASGAAWKGNPIQVGGVAANGKVQALLTDAVATAITGDNGTGEAANLTIVGNVAHDSADTSYPLKIGGKGSAAVASDVTEGDRVNASFTLAGRARTEDQAGYTAHDAADAGNPLKIGGKGSAAVASDVTEGDRVNASFTLAGRLRTEDAAGYVAHDAADAGNPLKIGGKGSAAVATAVTEGDRVNASFTLTGRLRSEMVGVARSVSGTAAIAADNQMLPATANLRLFKLFICEAKATPAVASGIIKHGVDGGTVISTFNLLASDSHFIDFGEGGVPIASGLWLDNVGGEFSVTAVYGVAD